MPNCHEVRSSRLLQSFPRVQDLVLFYVFFVSSTSLTLSSSDMYLRSLFWTSQPLFYNETFIFNFAALTTPWGHIVCRGLYHLLASKSADPLPQLLLTINRTYQIQIPNPNPKSYYLQRSLPPTGIQVYRSSATTTFDHQQKIPNRIPNHIVTSFFYHPLTSKSADPVPQQQVLVSFYTNVDHQQTVKPFCLGCHVKAQKTLSFQKGYPGNF